MQLMQVKRVAVVSLIGIALVAFAHPTLAQSDNGVSGTITDQQKGAIVGATVVLQGAGGEQRVQSDAAGQYRFVPLMPGTYTMTVQAQGFQTVTVEFTVGAGRPVSRDIELAIAGGAEIVNVSAAGFVERAREESATQSTVRKSAITLLGTAAQSNILKPLDLLPSLHVETPDPYGLSSRQPWNLRIRGQAGIGTGTMVEG